MAMKSPATAALSKFIDSEVSHALRRLRIPSLAAAKREGRFFESRYTDDGGYETAPAQVAARVKALETICGLAFDGLDAPLEIVDAWVLELRKDMLPKALKRPLTEEEKRKVFKAVDAARAKATAKAAADHDRWLEGAQEGASRGVGRGLRCRGVPQNGTDLGGSAVGPPFFFEAEARPRRPASPGAEG
jgi:hypothetical protein